MPLRRPEPARHRLPPILRSPHPASLPGYSNARRNLPDKELRYLRTVIVTAAVYRCFGRQLRGEPLTAFLNIPAPSRRHSVYVDLRLCTELCF